MKKIIVVVLICILVITGILYWFGRNETDSEQGVEYLIGMSQANLIEPWRIVMNEEIANRAKNYENVRIIYTNATQDNGKQIDDIKQLMDYGIDLLMISPNEAKELKEILDEVYEDIPIIVLDRDIGSAYSLYIGPDNNLIGEKAGEYVREILGEDGGVILELRGLEGSPPSIARSEGFNHIVNQYPNITIKDSLVCNWLKDSAEDQMKYYFLQNPDIDIVFAHNDAMAYGAYTAAQELRIEGDIKYIGVNGLAGPGGGIELVDDDILEATFYYPVGGTQAVDYAVRILDGDKDVPRILKLESEIYRN